MNGFDVDSGDEGERKEDGHTGMDGLELWGVVSNPRRGILKKAFRRKTGLVHV